MFLVALALEKQSGALVCCRVDSPLFVQEIAESLATT